MTNGRKARLGETRGPAAREDERRARRLPRALRDPEVRARRSSSPGRWCAASSASTAARRRRKAVLVDEDGKILCKAYQLSKGNPIQDTKELLAQAPRLRRRVRARSSRSSASARTGYAADVLEECVRADVNIVETVAHMMSAVHFFGDVDVICDIGGQDIKVLFMKNGDIANFRLSNSCSAGNGMLLQAMADSFGVAGHRVRRRRLQGRARAEVQLRLRRLPRHRPRELPEGGLLEGGDARRPRAGAAEERLAVRRADPAARGARHASSSSRAARSTTSRPSRRRSTTSRSASPDARGVRAPAHRRGRRDRRRDRDAPRRQAQGQVDASSASMRRSTSSTRRRTTKRRSVTSVRTSASARSSTRSAPTARRAATSRASPARRAPSRAKEAMLALVAERKKIAQQFPNMRRLRGEAGVPALLRRRRRMPEDGAPIKDVEVKKGIFGIRRVEITRPFKRSTRGVRGEAPPRCASASRACSTSTRRRRSSGRTSRRSASRSRTSSSATRRPKRCGSRAASTARSTRASRRKVAQAHVHNLLFHQHTGEEAAQLHLLPDPHARANFVDRHDGQRELPDRRRRARRDEGGVHEGGRLLRDARHRVPRSGALVRRADAHGAAHVRDVRARASASPRTRTTTPAREAWKALDASSRTTSQDKGRAILETVEAEDRVAILMIGRPYHSDPGLNHGIPEEFQVLGYPILSRALDPEGPRVPRSLLQGGAREGDHQDARSRSTTCGRRTTRSTARRRCGPRAFAAHHPNVVVLDLSTLQVRPRRADLRPHRHASSTRAKTPYAALHDIDANKPGGSIKIRVKTYAHALKLHEERLEDARKRKERARARASTRSASSSSSCKTKQLAARSRPGPGARARRSRSSRAQRRELRGADARPSPSRPKGLVQLGKKTADGTSFRARSTDCRDKQPVSKDTMRHHGHADESRPTVNAKKTLPIVGDVDIDAELKKFEEEERERLGLDKQDRAVGRGHGRPRASRRRRARRSRCSSAASRSRTTTSSRARSRLGYNVQMLDCPTNEGLQTGKEFGNRGQCNPTYFTVGNLVKYLITLRDKHGMTAEGDRREVRLPHRRRVRPVPLRHVRHRVPQGAPRRRLRRLPRHALPADRRPQAGDGRRRRPRAEPAVLLGASSRRIVAGDVLNALGYRIRPYEVDAGRTDRAIEEAKKIIYEALENKTNIMLALWKCKPILAAVEGRQDAAEAEGQHHRRVLGDDDRGRRQLPAPALPRERGRRERHPARRPRGSSTTSGRCARHEGAREPARRRHGEVRPRRAAASSASPRSSPACGAADSVVRVALPDVRARRSGLYGYHLPDMDDDRRGRHEYYNNDLRGGEGHMEVGKLIINVVTRRRT